MHREQNYQQSMAYLFAIKHLTCSALFAHWNNCNVIYHQTLVLDYTPNRMSAKQTNVPGNINKRLFLLLND